MHGLAKADGWYTEKVCKMSAYHEKSLQKVCKKFSRRRLFRLVQTFENVCTSLPPNAGLTSAQALLSRSPLTARVPVGPQSMWLGHVVPGSFHRGSRSASPVWSAAGGAGWLCTEQLLPGSAPWPEVPHRGLRSLRCLAESTIGDRPCVVADGEESSWASSSRPMVVPN